MREKLSEMREKLDESKETTGETRRSEGEGGECKKGKNAGWRKWEQVSDAPICSECRLPTSPRVGSALDWSYLG